MSNQKKRFVVDQYDNRFTVKVEEIARGGQGAIYQTEEGDLAVKQPLNECGDIDRDPKSVKKIEALISLLRSLPLPQELHVTIPLSALKSEPGYVMKMLSGMKAYEHFNRVASAGEVEKWCALHPNIALPDDQHLRGRLVHFIQTGSFKARYKVLYKCACELARLHCAGIVYGDLSPGNLFLTEDLSEVWLIDPDNMRLDSSKGAKFVYTPHYGAPELVQLRIGATSASDIWAFAVMAFESLYLQHPFIGQGIDGEDAWDADESDVQDEDSEEKAYRGELPFIDDPEDDSNPSSEGFPRDIFAPIALRVLFVRTLGYGRTDPFVRVTPPIWAQLFAKLHDSAIECPKCGMTYDVSNVACPFCEQAKPAYVQLSYEGRKLVFVKRQGNEPFVVDIPHRFFHPFSVVFGDQSVYQVTIDFDKKTVNEVRMTTKMPFKPKVSFINSEVSDEF